MNLKTVKLGVLAVLVLIMSLGLTTTALADKPFCSNADMPAIIKTGNSFTVTWTGSNPVRRAWVVIPWDNRGHWLGGTLRHDNVPTGGRSPLFGRLAAPYAQLPTNFLLSINEGTFEKTLWHSGTSTMTLPADVYFAAQLIIQTWYRVPPFGHDPVTNLFCKTELPVFEVTE